MLNKSNLSRLYVMCPGIKWNWYILGPHQSSQTSKRQLEKESDQELDLGGSWVLLI